VIKEHILTINRSISIIIKKIIGTCKKKQKQKGDTKLRFQLIKWKKKREKYSYWTNLNEHAKYASQVMRSG